MTLPIQRVPAGLGQLLSTFGGTTPRELEEVAHGSIELLQMYGLSQRQTLVGANGALAEGGSVLALTGAQTNWSVLFGIEMQVVKTGTMTALAASLRIGRNAGAPSLAVHAAASLGPFGATETGTVRLAWWAPYPVLLPPGSQVLVGLDILGTDATAAVNALAEIGILG